jgi:hypothetical protein
MSRSNNVDLTNPAQRFFEWKARSGELTYYDKSLGENGENVTVPVPFKFLILDKVAQITGGKKIGQGKDKQFIGYFSNAIRNTKTEKFVVRDKNGIVGEGLYENVKKITGVKFMIGLYIAFYGDNKELQIGYLKLKGCAMSAWIEFSKNHRNLYDGAFSITRGIEDEDEDGKAYYHPAFAHSTNVTTETDDLAKELDVELQEYLKAYFARNHEEAVAVEAVETTGFAQVATVGGRYDAQAPGGFNPAEDQEDDGSDLPF